MLDIVLERRDIIEPNGDATELLIARLQNLGSEPVPLDHVLLNFPITDTAVKALTVWDGREGLPRAELRAGTAGAVIFHVWPRGEVSPGATRTVGLYLLRRRLASVHGAGISFSDPVWFEDVRALPAGRCLVETTVVFPSIGGYHEVLAEGAVRSSSRAATWRYVPEERRFERFHANYQLTCLPLSSSRVDDGIAELHRLIGLDAAGQSLSRAAAEQLESRLALPLEEWEVPAPPALSLLRGLALQSPEERQRRLREVMVAVEGARESLLRNAPSVRLADDVPTVALDLAQQIRRLIPEHQVAGRVPDRIFDMTQQLLRFVASKRRQGSAAWPKQELDERYFQARLHDFLLGFTPYVEKEVETGEGRVDFMLEGVPVELKAQSLGRAPREKVGEYTQQAADYASNRGSAVAILLVLDKTASRTEKAHQAHLLEQTRVDVVASREGLRETGGTLVVSMLLDAYPPKPSVLRGTRLKR